MRIGFIAKLSLSRNLSSVHDKHIRMIKDQVLKNTNNMDKYTMCYKMKSCAVVQDLQAFTTHCVNCSNDLSIHEIFVCLCLLMSS